MFVDSAPSTGEILAQIVSRSGKITVLNTEIHTGGRPSVVHNMAIMSFIEEGSAVVAVGTVFRNPGGVDGCDLVCDLV